jgi:aminomethyltransferase
MGLPQETTAGLLTTPLHALHVGLGARMVPFAGYDMPVQYPAGIIAEHAQCRTSAALFDVSHMGQVKLTGQDVAGALERVCPGDVRGLQPGRMRYSVLTTEDGGIIDDFMIYNLGADWMLVLNAARKAEDMAHLRQRLGGELRFTPLENAALIALQGPKAAEAMSRHMPGAADMPFLSARYGQVGPYSCLVSRSGYTGEDGFEISTDGAHAADLARLLLSDPEVAPAGLGARDSLRLEAGLCLYGQDIDLSTSPVEAGLSFVIAKSRRDAGDFPGAAGILAELRDGPKRLRVGIRPEGKAPARHGTAILDVSGAPLGEITSGGYAPTLEAPVAMGYVAAGKAETGGKISLSIRGKLHAAEIVDMPFVPHRYHRRKPS